jgi:hypothetical protein
MKRGGWEDRIYLIFCINQAVGLTVPSAHARTKVRFATTFSRVASPSHAQQSCARPATQGTAQCCVAHERVCVQRVAQEVSMDHVCVAHGARVRYCVPTWSCARCVAQMEAMGAA